MKKLISVILILAILCTFAAAVAETWTCPNCGKESDGNFCPWCAAANPAPVVVCSNCGAKYDPALGYFYCPNCAAPLTGKAKASVIAVGDVITFGCYEQDNDINNGPEAIEWIVLDMNDGKALLLSKYALDAKPYNTEQVDITWEQCTLRAWLNNEFLKSAFSDTEQSVIVKVYVYNSHAQGCREYNSTGGNNTADQIFLLSYHEAFDMYFANDEARMCVLTDYAMAQGASHFEDYQADGRFAGAWWLRSPGITQGAATIVSHLGSSYSLSVHYGIGVVRPALWVDLESGIF